MVRLGSLGGEARAWSMAHLEGLLNGMLLLAVAAVARRLSLKGREQTILFWSMLVMAYGNLVAAVLAASFGVRGLEPAGPAANLVVYALFMAALVGAFAGIGLVAYGAAGRSEETAAKVTVEVTPAGEVRSDEGPAEDEGAARPGGRSQRRRRKRRKAP
ncbi:MAG: hypothetical protein D6760_02310 [Deltaproteobacteria bacterium]|nr:MAG: hypothetical protein D6760_02310 [Deltaproteobacteria bacterium]